jgi:hypothetical protein
VERARFFSADAGIVRFSSVGWTSIGAPTGPGPVPKTPRVADLSEGQDFIYRFTPKVGGTLLVDYTVHGTGALFGLNGFRIILDGRQVGIAFVNTSGQLKFSLPAGGVDSLQIRNIANIEGTVGNRTANMDGTFKFGFQSPVPEPSTLMTAGAGAVALVAFARRRAGPAGRRREAPVSR